MADFGIGTPPTRDAAITDAMQPIDSPCVKICVLHEQLQLCTGCGRTLAEIEQWPTLSREQRIGLIDIVRQRLEALRERHWQAVP